MVHTAAKPFVKAQVKIWLNVQYTRHFGLNMSIVEHKKRIFI